MILHIADCVYNLIFHIRPSYMKKIWRKIEHLLITAHTYRQIHWSDCQYRRPGSCNRHTRSRWISPFLVEDGEGKQRRWLPGQHDEHILGMGVELTTRPPFTESTEPCGTQKKKEPLLTDTHTGHPCKACERNTIIMKEYKWAKIFNKAGMRFQRCKGSLLCGEKKGGGTVCRLHEPHHYKLMKGENIHLFSRKLQSQTLHSQAYSPRAWGSLLLWAAFSCFSMLPLHIHVKIISKIPYYHHYIHHVLVMCTTGPHPLCGCRWCFLSEGRCGRARSESQSERGVSSMTPFQLTTSQYWVPLVEWQGCKR